MITLTGRNLGERQKDLNEKVSEAVQNKVSFDSLKPEKSEADIDILFKIDLAAKYKNIDYILEIFKSSDSLYISRAVKKCVWLGANEFAAIINANNLHDNVYPHMSMKMKKKLLYSLSMYVEDDNRTVAFHEYCMNMKMYNAAIKFLLKTPESYKQEVIFKKCKSYKLLSENNDNLRFFIGDSLLLADVYLASFELDLFNKTSIRTRVLYTLRHLYSVSEVGYLDLLEKYICTVTLSVQIGLWLGCRLSKDIMKTHKDRVLKNSRIYVNLLKKNILAKKSTVDDVKVYTANLLPEDAISFWYYNFYGTYKYIIDVIPANERFSYIKELFNKKYPNEPFETCLNFHTYQLYELFNTKDKEDWALRHIASEEELLGGGNNYMWYKFVNFEKAFEEIKKLILITLDGHKRLEIISVLIYSAKDQDELAKLLNYFYNRHVNESKQRKQTFINKLIKQHNVFNFNEECWAALEKILYSLDVFNKLTYTDCNSDYVVTALIYYITRKDTVLEVLNEFIDMDVISFHKMRALCCKLDVQKQEIIFQYFLQFYLTRVEALSKETFKDEIKKEIHRYIDLSLRLLSEYSKKRDNIPELMYTYIKTDWNTTYRDHIFFKYSAKDIVKIVKKDVVQVIIEFPKIKKYVEDGNNTNWLTRKLRIYFHHDIAGQYLQLVNDCIALDTQHYTLVKFAVYVIFYLADDGFKIDFMEKHVPTSAKIDHATISRKYLSIQREICSQACISRPPLPMKYILRFITGDYLQYCLPIFNYYLMNLPPSQCIEFVESLIDKPVSIQKHGLRLAFKCFTAENLTTLTNNIWKKTKNVYIRGVVYKALYDKVVNESGQTQLQLFEVLKTLTLDLHQDDSPAVFELLTKDTMTYDLMGHYLVSAWEAVKTFPENKVNLCRMTDVIRKIEVWLHMVPEEVHIVITDEHIFEMLDKKQILNTEVIYEKKQLYNAKWKLTDRYLTYVYKREQITRNLGVIKHITKQVIEMWDEVRNDHFVLREFCSSFLITALEEKSYDVHAVESYSNVNTIQKTILKMLKESLPEHEIYFMIWQLRLSDITRKIIIAGKQEIKSAADLAEIVKAMKTSSLRFADAFGNLVKEYVRNKKYFVSFCKPIESCILNKLRWIIYKLDANKENFQSEDLLIMVCAGLLKFKIPEIYMFIAMVLPLYYTNEKMVMVLNDHRRVIRVLKSMKNDEIRYFLYNKYAMTDFQYRNNI